MPFPKLFGFALVASFVIVGLPELVGASPDSGWNIRTVDSTGDVGGYTSIALDSSGYPHISYHDDTNSDLKYARWTGSSWSIENVTSVSIFCDSTSIALDENDHPHISYGPGLKYASRTGVGEGEEVVPNEEIPIIYVVAGVVAIVAVVGIVFALKAIIKPTKKKGEKFARRNEQRTNYS